MPALVLFFCKNSSIITNDEITVDIITHIKPAVFCFALSSFSLTAPLTIALGWVDRAVFEFGGRRVNVLSRQRTKGCWRSTSRLILSHLGSKYDRICNCSKSIALLTIVQVSSPSQKDACVCRCLFKVTFVFCMKSLVSANADITADMIVYLQTAILRSALSSFSLTALLTIALGPALCSSLAGAKKKRWAEENRNLSFLFPLIGFIRPQHNGLRFESFG